MVEALQRATRLPLDVHLMIREPERYLDVFAEAGASVLTVHVEATTHLHRTISAHSRARACEAGVAINPATPVGVLEEIVADVDVVLVMSVNPGYSGQTFIPRSESKTAAVRDAASSGRARRRVSSWTAASTRPTSADWRGRRVGRSWPGRRSSAQPTRARPCGACAGAEAERGWRPDERHVADAGSPATSVSQVRVRYAETDQMGVVYYANYFVWFEVGRTDLLRALGRHLPRPRSGWHVPARHRGVVPVRAAEPLR